MCMLYLKHKRPIRHLNCCTIAPSTVNDWRKEGYALFNNSVNTFSSDHSDSERGNPLIHGLLFLWFFYMHHPTDWIALTNRGTLAGTRNSSMDPPWGLDPMIRHILSRRSTMKLHLAPCQRTRTLCTSVWFIQFSSSDNIT